MIQCVLSVLSTEHQECHVLKKVSISLRHITVAKEWPLTLLRLELLVHEVSNLVGIRVALTIVDQFTTQNALEVRGLTTLMPNFLPAASIPLSSQSCFSPVCAIPVAG